MLTAMQRRQVVGALVVVLVIVVIIYVARRHRRRQGFGDVVGRIEGQRVLDGIDDIQYERNRDVIPAYVVQQVAQKRPKMGLTHEERAELEATDQLSGDPEGRRGTYEPYVAGGDAALELEQCHATTPVDYGEIALAAVADSNMLTRQRNWYDHMADYSGAAGVRNLDALDVSASIPRVGLWSFNERGPVQTNALQITEIDSYDLAANSERRNYKF